MSWLRKKFDPTAFGAGAGAAIATLITYFFDTPTPVAIAIVGVFSYFLGHVSPDKINQDHAMDLSGGES